MDAIQTTCRGKSLNHKKDASGFYYVTMMGCDALLYFPVEVEPNSEYKVSLDVNCQSGNGIIYCNIFGNKNFDFPHVSVCCEDKEWKSYDITVQTKDFPKNIPFTFRIWRKPDGTGNISIKKIVVEKKSINDEEESIVENKYVIRQIKVAVPESAVAKSAKKIIPDPKPTVFSEAPVPIIEKKSEDITDEEIKPFIRLDNAHDPSAVKVLVFHYSHEANRQSGLNQYGLLDAFADNGFNVCSFNFNTGFNRLGHAKLQQAFIYLAKKFQPDWIHMQLQFFVDHVSPDTISEIRYNACPKAYMTNWSADVRNDADHYFVKIGKIVHRPLIVSEGQLEMHRQAGCKNVDYWQVGYDPKYFFRKTNAQRSKLHSLCGHDIAFCGNRISWHNFPGTSLREEVASKLSFTFNRKFGLYGHGWSLEAHKVHPSSFKRYVLFYEQNEIYNGSIMSISLNHYNNIKKYFSDRQLVCLAAGSLAVSAYIPDMEYYFENGKDLVWFKTADECIDICKYYSKHPELADKIGMAGALKAYNEHTYFCRVKELAKRLGFK